MQPLQSPATVDAPPPLLDRNNGEIVGFGLNQPRRIGKTERITTEHRMQASARAYLKGGRTGAGLAALRAEVGRLMAGFAANGAVPVEPAALLPADILIDLYGEDWDRLSEADKKHMELKTFYEKKFLEKDIPINYIRFQLYPKHGETL